MESFIRWDRPDRRLVVGMAIPRGWVWNESPTEVAQKSSDRSPLGSLNGSWIREW